MKVMNVPIGAEVQCTDRATGRSTRVSVNPVTRRVTYLVVRERGPWRTERLAPIGRVSGTANNLIHLDCTRQELARMEPLQETRFVWADLSDFSLPHAVPVLPEAGHESLPRDRVCVCRGARVQATDGDVGSIDKFVLVPASGEITHLLLREGHAWGRGQAAIPFSEIERFEERTVYLKRDKRSLERLPSFKVWKRLH